MSAQLEQSARHRDPRSRWHAPTLALLALACLCASATVAFTGPVRTVSGLMLALFLPGRLAVDALFQRRGDVDRWLRAVLTVVLSLITVMAVGLTIGLARLGFGAATVAIGLLIACVAIAAPTLMRRHPESMTRPRLRLRRFSSRYALAALPAAALTVLLIVQIAAATHRRGPDSYYTELGLGPSATVTVHSLEKGATSYRYVVRSGGSVRASVRFSLRPGEHRTFILPSSPSAGRLDVLLYTGTHSAPYRRLIVPSG